MSRFLPIVSVIVTFMVICACSLAVADPFHRSGVLVGERAAAMGGAFTALGDDGSAGHYNPAALVTLPGDSFSLSASLYGFHAERIVGSPRTVDHFSLLDFQTIPGATAAVRELWSGREDGTLRVVGGFGLFVVEHESSATSLHLRDVRGTSLGGETVLFDRFLHTARVDGKTLEGTLSVAIRATSWLDVGISALVLYRTLLRDESWDGAIEAGGATRFFRLQLAIDGAWVGLAGALGVHVTPTEGLHIGLQLRTPPVRLYGGADVSGALWSQADEPSRKRYPEVSVSVEHRLAPELSLGVAWQMPRLFTVAADVALRFPMDPYMDVDDPDFGRLVERNLAWDVALGVEGYPLDWLALRAGFFTSRTSGGDGDPVLDPVPAVDELGVSGGVGFHVGPTTLSLGAHYRWGEGPMLPLGPYSIERVTRRTETLRVLLATTYYY